MQGLFLWLSFTHSHFGSLFYLVIFLEFLLQTLISTPFFQFVLWFHIFFTAHSSVFLLVNNSSTRLEARNHTMFRQISCDLIQNKVSSQLRSLYLFVSSALFLPLNLNQSLTNISKFYCHCAFWNSFLFTFVDLLFSAKDWNRGFE